MQKTNLHPLGAEIQILVLPLKYMRKFAEVITNETILQTVPAELSWSHNTYQCQEGMMEEA